VVTHGITFLTQRDWARVRASKDRYWGERIRRLGASEGFRIADELRRQVLLLDPLWPHPAEREADLQWHIRFSALLRRADRTRRP
jgi:hypothetical protein